MKLLKTNRLEFKIIMITFISKMLKSSTLINEFRNCELKFHLETYEVHRNP